MIPTKSKELAYLVGVYLGDGSVSKHKNGFLRFSLGAIDEEFVEYTSHLLCEFGFRVLRHEYQPKRGQRMFFTTVHDSEFGRLLKTSTHNKRTLPKWILRERDFFIEMVNGLLDSEGWVGKTRVKDTMSGYKYSVGINMTSLWLPRLIRLMSYYGVKVGRCYLPKKEKSHYKQKFWFQFNVQSFVDSPFKFRIGRKQSRLNEYVETKLNRDSAYYAKIGLRGAAVRWGKRIKANSVKA